MLPEKEFPDLCTATATVWKEVLNEAFRCGVHDAMEGLSLRTGKDLAEDLTSNWRKGHLTYLRSMYMAGRFQIAAQSADVDFATYHRIMRGK